MTEKGRTKVGHQSEAIHAVAKIYNGSDMANRKEFAQARPPANGLYVPVPTFFRDEPGPSPSPDLETQAAHALHLLRRGIDGIALLGSTGEAVAIANTERRELVQHVRHSLDQNGFQGRPLLVGTTTQVITEVVAQLQEAESAGADHGLVLAPGFFAPGFFAPTATQDGLAGWFEAVADASPLPILVYNYPTVSNGLVMLPATMARLAAHPRIVGCKLSHQDVAVHGAVAANAARARPGFATFIGMATDLPTALATGGAGAIDGVAGVCPRAVWALFATSAAIQRSSEPDEPRLRSLQRAVQTAYVSVAKFGMPVIKAAVMRRMLNGAGSDRVRLPLRALSDQEWQESSDAFSALMEWEDKLEAEARRTE